MILSLNCGSSSVKYQVYDWAKQKVVINGTIDRIGVRGGCADHKTAIKKILSEIDQSSIQAVGHRVVHGGDKFAYSVIIDNSVLAEIKANVDLAPLHNPPNIVGIEAALEVLPNIKQVAVFDTAFHQTIPEYAYLYGLDYDLSKKYGIRRYGFHGSSHRFVTEKALKLLKKKNAKVITIHVGNGSSLTASIAGKSVDTSMGMTPLQGVVMGTRCGDIDPALVQYLMQQTGESADKIVDRFNKTSGMLGISGVSSDYRDIVAGADKGDKRCQLALQVQAYSIKKYIGSYLAVLGGADAIVFTAGIGENSARFRAAVCEGLDGLGILLDPKKNADKNAKKKHYISKLRSKVKVLVIPTNEEYILARDVISLVISKTPSSA